MSHSCRVVYRFGIFSQYLVGISQYLPNRYRRKTWLVLFGIMNWREPPFPLKICTYDTIQQTYNRERARRAHLEIPTEIPTDQYQYMVYQYRYQKICQYQNGIQLQSGALAHSPPPKNVGGLISEYVDHKKRNLFFYQLALIIAK